MLEGVVIRNNVYRLDRFKIVTKGFKFMRDVAIGKKAAFTLGKSKVCSFSFSKVFFLLFNLSL